MDREYLGVLHDLESQNNETFIDIETISNDGIDGCTDARRKIELEQEHMVLAPKFEIFNQEKNSTGDRPESTVRDGKMTKIYKLTEKLRNLEMENEILESKCSHKFRDFDAIKMHINVAIHAKFEERRAELEQTILNLRSKIQETSEKLTKKSNKARREFLRSKIENGKEKLEIFELDREILGVETRLEQEMELKMGMEEVLGIPRKEEEETVVVDQTVKEMVEVVGREEEEENYPETSILNPMDIDFDAPESAKTLDSQNPESSRLQYSTSSASENPFQRKLRPRKLKIEVKDSEDQLNPSKSKKAKMSDSEVLKVEGSRKSQRIQNLSQNLSRKSEEPLPKRGRPRKSEDSESQRLLKIQKSKKPETMPTRRSLRLCQNQNPESKEDSEGSNAEFKNPEDSRIVVKDSEGCKSEVKRSGDVKDPKALKFDVQYSEGSRVVVKDSESSKPIVNISEALNRIFEDSEDSNVIYKDSEGQNLIFKDSEFPKVNVKDSKGSRIVVKDSEPPKIDLKGFKNLNRISKASENFDVTYQNPDLPKVIAKDSESQKIKFEDSKVLNLIVKDSEEPPNIDVKNPECSRIVPTQESKPQWKISSQRLLNPPESAESKISKSGENSESQDIEILKTRIFLNLDSEFQEDLVKVEIESEDEGERIHPEFHQNTPNPIPIVEEPEDSLDAYFPRGFRIQKDSEIFDFSKIVVEDSEASRVDVKNPEVFNFDDKESGDSGVNNVVENPKESEPEFSFLFAKPTDITE